MPSSSGNIGISDTWKTLGIAFFVVIVIFLIWLVSAGTWVSPQAQTIYVVRNGGPFDNKNIRQVISPGSGWTWTGVASTSHAYPDSTQQRFYTITSDPTRGDRPGVDVVTVPSKDGVLVGMEGTLYLRTAFDGSTKGKKLVEDFDNQFGTRTFPVAGTNDELHPYSGNGKGWAAFLDTVVRPVIDNELRIAIGKFDCSELVSSCALVQGTAKGTTVDISAIGSQNQANIQKVQREINTGLAADLKATLGENYFISIQFKLGKPDLPTGIQEAINGYQAQRVKNNTAALKVQEATQEANANAKKAISYKDCPACAQIDQIKALPAGTTVLFGVQPVVSIGGSSSSNTK